MIKRQRMLDYANKKSRFKRMPVMFNNHMKEVDPLDVGKNPFLNTISEFGQLTRYKQK